MSLDRQERPGWHRMAACRGLLPVSHWYPEQGASGRLGIARRVLCGSCPVREKCAEVGMRERFGWFGGLSEKDRKLLRRDGELTLRTGEVALFDQLSGEVIFIDCESESLSVEQAREFLLTETLLVVLRELADRPT